MRRASTGLLVVTAAGALLGAWMTADGLHIRLYGEFARLFGSDLPTSLITAAGLSAQRVGWPLLVIGLMWFGAVAGLWLGLRLGFQTAVALASLSLVYLGPGTVLGLIALAGLWAGRLHQPVASAEA